MLHPYIRLTRLHRPTGIWLLLWPCWWSVVFASRDLPSFGLLALFGLGAVLMRSAGCIFNDIVDRKFDKEVERTRSRPLASGEMKLPEALIVLGVLLLLAFTIALAMKPIVLVLAALSLVFVIAYPFMKRITWWPQAFLGLTFNWGALMGWAAVTGNVALPALLLYVGGIGWTLGYDTIYAHQDKEDDMKIGVKSTALLLSQHSKAWIVGFYGLALFFWAVAGWFNHSGWPYYAGIALVAAHFLWQVKAVKLSSPESCLHIFASNTVAGLILFAGLWADNIRAALIHL